MCVCVCVERETASCVERLNTIDFPRQNTYTHANIYRDNKGQQGVWRNSQIEKNRYAHADRICVETAMCVKGLDMRRQNIYTCIDKYIEAASYEEIDDTEVEQNRYMYLQTKTVMYGLIYA